MCPIDNEEILRCVYPLNLFLLPSLSSRTHRDSILHNALIIPIIIILFLSTPNSPYISRIVLNMRFRRRLEIVGYLAYQTLKSLNPSWEIVVTLGLRKLGTSSMNHILLHSVHVSCSWYLVLQMILRTFPS